MTVQDQILIPVGRLQLVFQWQGDRYGHRVRMACDEAKSVFERQSILESTEGLPDDVWPASPPLQECHLESRPDGRTVALLVGRAGKSHWSLSVLCDPAASRLLFEVACRLTGEPAWLGSRYRVPGTLNAGINAGAVTAQILLADRSQGADGGATGQKWLLGLPLLGQHLAAERIDGPIGQIEIAARALAGTGPRTVQWSYEVSPNISKVSCE